MSLKTTARRVGSALCEVANELHNSSIRTEIENIDKEADALRAQLARLEEKRSEKEAELIR
jgi:chaperonin cofactor prefoldin